MTLAFDGLACVEMAEKLLDTLRTAAPLFGAELRLSHGLGFAIKRTLEIAHAALSLCPLQPGDRVEIAKRLDCSAIFWPQHMFETGQTAEVMWIDLRDSGYTVAIRFDHETWIDHHGEKHDLADDRRGAYPGVSVEYLRKALP